MKDDGVYELIGGRFLLVTQAIKETKDSVIMRSFDDVKEVGIIPIAEACRNCGEWHFAGSRKNCRKLQEADARIRGFRQVICPNQFKE